MKSTASLGGLLACLLSATPLTLSSRAEGFDGLNVQLGNLHRTSSAKSRSISPENFTGEKGQAGMAVEGAGKNAARELGQTWKVSPCVHIAGKTTFTLGEIKGPGSIQSIWMTPTGNWRTSILRFYWDNETEPSIEVPVGDFFACGLGQYTQLSSLAVCVNPGSAFNCYWPMPFRKKARITLENLADQQMTLYYQVNYALGPVTKDAAYLHAQFRREDRLQTKGLYTILDGIKGRGHYVGTYLAWEVFSPGWWGEGEIKFFMDGDTKFPTICGTGTEDYFCGSYNFDTKGPEGRNRYTVFNTPYTGLAQVIPADQIYQPGQRFGLYRWHIPDPVRFEKDLKVTIQALGWQDGGRYLQLQDDIASVGFWYQTEPHAPFPPLPAREKLLN
ncbi:MAG: DUF2961 domain-containing protein [Verrucomicrobiales bacterium]|nr:DUF2961 domain-containing protein [Verrucomicrobiales bacterium]